MSMVGLRDVLVVTPASSFHPHHHHHHHESQLLPSGEQPTIPLLTAAPCFVDDHTRATGIHLWQQGQQTSPNPNPNLRKPMPMPMSVPMLDSAAAACSGIFNSAGGGGPILGGGGAIVPLSPSSTITCQDCGNQAKKDCTHRRCRTCCKSRGFDCTTHIKSTWVPATRRRERQQLSAALAAGGGTVGSSASTSGSKKPRLLTSTSNTTASHTSTSNTPPRSFDTTSSHQDAGYRENLPRYVRAPAVFKCVRVTSIEDGEDEYAYQAMVNIGGHVFKGFLYDQGAEDEQARDHINHDEVDDHHATCSNNNNATTIQNLSELQLGGKLVGGPSDVYGGGGGHLMGGGGGTAYGNPTS